MAIPPEPLPQLLARAKSVVEAKVVAILEQGTPPKPVTEPKPSAPNLLRSQRVKLEVRRVLRGAAKLGELVVEKPESHYLLEPGNEGPFFLDASEPPRILGRYGPDSYRLASVEAALARR
jgi:hypothetical protein